MFDSRESAFRAMIATDMLKSAGATKLKFNPNGTATFSLLGAKWTLDRRLNAEPIMRRTVDAALADYHVTGNAEQFASKGDVWASPNQQTSAWKPLSENPRRNDFGELCMKPTIEGYEGWDEPKYVAPRVRPVLKLKIDDAPRKLCQIRKAYREGKL